MSYHYSSGGQWVLGVGVDHQGQDAGENLFSRSHHDGCVYSYGLYRLVNQMISSASYIWIKLFSSASNPRDQVIIFCLLPLRPN